MTKLVPLCVDLDGTLIKTDVLWEGLIDIVRRRRSLLIHLPRWLKAGKADFKSRVSEVARINPALVPYRTEVLEYTKQARQEGRKIVLVTAASEKAARSIANHLKLFDEIIASDKVTNIAGQVKADALRSRYGENSFDYMGNAAVDLKVWKYARTAIVVDGTAKLIRQAQNISNNVVILTKQSRRWQYLLRAARPHQWVKNLLVFVPLIMAHTLSSYTLERATIAWVALSVVASALYILNDLLDLEADRRHPRKKRRPFASGSVPIWYGLVAIPVLLMIGGVLGLVLGLEFIAIVAIYALGSLSYSLWVKRIAFLDVILLSSLYMVRLIAGAEASAVPISRWLLLFSICFFLSLALLKRFTEVDGLEKKEQTELHRRGYDTTHRQLLLVSGMGSALVSIVVLALYVSQSRQVPLLYSQPYLLWLIIPLFLVWMIRIWYLAAKGKMHDDPVAFAVKDILTYGVVILVVSLLVFAA